MAKKDRHTETVLVVDGDIITRTVIAEYLRDCGYRVLEANDAPEAQKALQHHGFQVEVILSDIMLPSGMTGFELATWIRQHMPHVKVLLSAAESRTASVAGELCEEGPHLAKPYDPAIVLQNIKRLRGGSEG